MTCPGRGPARARAKWCAADPGPLRSVAVPDQRCTAAQELRAAPHPGHGRSAELFDRDIRLADDAAIFVDLTPQVGAEFGTAHADRKEPLLGKLGFHVGGLQRAAEPAG